MESSEAFYPRVSIRRGFDVTAKDSHRSDSFIKSNHCLITCIVCVWNRLKQIKESSCMR